jgi:hypothetical protein
MHPSSAGHSETLSNASEISTSNNKLELAALNWKKREKRIRVQYRNLSVMSLPVSWIESDQLTPLPSHASDPVA